MPTYRITINGNEYTVDVPNPHERPVRAIVNDETIEVYVDNDTIQTPLVSMKDSSTTMSETRISFFPEQITSQPSSTPTSSSGYIKSPLPGSIVSISVSEGDRVEPGQELCVLEAMKMNNPVRSTVSGTVAEIFVAIGQQVQHGAPIMTIED